MCSGQVDAAAIVEEFTSTQETRQMSKPLPDESQIKAKNPGTCAGIITQPNKALLNVTNETALFQVNKELFSFDRVYASINAGCK